MDDNKPDAQKHHVIKWGKAKVKGWKNAYKHMKKYGGEMIRVA